METAVDGSNHFFFIYFNEETIGTVDEYTVLAVYYTGKSAGQSQHYCETPVFKGNRVVVAEESLDRSVRDQVRQMTSAYMQQSNRWQRWSGMPNQIRLRTGSRRRLLLSRGNRIPSRLKALFCARIVPSLDTRPCTGA